MHIRTVKKVKSERILLRYLNGGHGNSFLGSMKEVLKKLKGEEEAKGKDRKCNVWNFMDLRVGFIYTNPNSFSLLIIKLK